MNSSENQSIFLKRITIQQLPH